MRRRVLGSASILTLQLLPLTLTAFWVVASIVIGPSRPGWPHASDLHTFWVAARTAVHGGNPYPLPHDVAHWTTRSQQSFVYPPAALAVVVPLAYVSYMTAMILFLPLLAIAVVIGLRLLGVRDWRCYGAAFLWPSTLTSIGIGTLSPLLFLGLAALWRWRDRRVVTVLAASCVVTAKLFLWPVLVWMWFTGRRSAAVVAAALGVAASGVAWALIGFDGLRQYPTLLRTLSATEGRHSLSPISLFGGAAAPIAAVLAAVAVAAIAKRSGSRVSFSATVTLAVLVSPIVWLHYFVLLALVLAVTRPRFGVVWLVPALGWLTLGPPYGGGWRTVLVTVVVAGVWAGVAAERIPHLRALVTFGRARRTVLSLNDA